MDFKKKNVLIANGHELIGQLSWPKGGGPKWLPYTIEDARKSLLPDLENIIDIAKKPDIFTTPRGEITAKIILHPAFLAKSYFPASILRDAGLSIVGSRPEKVVPRRTKNESNESQETAAIFVSGSSSSFEVMSKNLFSIETSNSKQEQFARIEKIKKYDFIEKLRINNDSRWPDHFHITIHATEADSDILTLFAKYVTSLGGKISDRGFRFVPGLTFVAIKLHNNKISELAKFSRVRLIRSLPELQEEWQLTSTLTRGYSDFKIPTTPALSSTRIAIFDGGVINAFPGYAKEISGPALPPSSPKDLSHGINVTSAFLFGALNEKMKNLPVPYCLVDHHKVLPTTDTPEKALDVLDRIITALKSAKIMGTPYRFANISLGPIASFFDDDIHEWTSRLDNELSDGQTLCTVAVGNNGLHEYDLSRIQPPGDAVNVMSIGSSNSNQKKWNKADYSAIGPGRSPGFVKPDVVSFGGSNGEPLPIFNPLAGTVIAVAGTSYASPLALRVAAGVDTLSNSVFDPVTLQALLINSCEFNTRTHNRSDVGWGRISNNPEDVLYTQPDVIRVVYQGITRPGHPQKALIPIPKNLPVDTKVILGATFCYRAPVDSAHAINYTRAGLWVRAYKAPKKSIPLFGSGMYKTEGELRKDAMRWDTVLHAKKSVNTDDLIEPYFHINYQVRDEGESVRVEDAVPMAYALVVTIEVPGIIDLLQRVQAEFPILQTLPTNIEPDVNLPL
ncbi:S8 family peptidase [Pectobacterium odoriferum]|uniref:S8 family peptidase n=1 Tax=Pectobacterium TaxID=122277 RepID=UPI0032EBB763